jgi:hypothetical protein
MQHRERLDRLNLELMRAAWQYARSSRAGKIGKE